MTPEGGHGFDWRIRPHVDRVRIAAYCYALNRALHQAAYETFARATTPADLGAFFSRPCPRSFWVLPETSWLIDEIHGDSDLEVLRRIAALISRAASEHRPLPQLSFQRSLPSWARYGIAYLEAELRQAGYKCYLRFGENERSVTRLSEALALIGRVWPEAREQIDDLVRFIVPVGGYGLRSGTVSRTFGAVYVGMDDPCLDAVRLADLLVHESAHLQLEVNQAHGALLKNPLEKGRSPLRPDPRPLDGILHAAFVLRRVLSLLSKVSDQGAPDEVATARGLMENYRPALLQCLTVLERQAAWTEQGACLFASLREGGL